MTGLAAVRDRKKTAGASASNADSEDEFFSQVLVAWLKDTREVARKDVVKRFRELFEKGVTEREFVLRSQRLGVNTALVIAQNVVRLPSFQKLDLYENLVRDAGCEAIAGLVRESSTLSHLNLGGNDIGPPGAMHLASVVTQQHARNLQVLILGSADTDMHVNRIDATSGRALAEAIRKNKNMRVVDMNRNPLGKGDQEAFGSFGLLLERNQQLKVLRLGSTSMSTESAQFIVSKLSNNSVLEEIDLHNNDLGHQVGEGLARVLVDKRNRGQRCSLQRLLLHGNPRIGERGTSALFGALASSNVVQIDLQRCGVTDDAAIALAAVLDQAPTLQHINLSRNYITHIGCMALAQQLEEHGSLQYLSLSQNKLRCEGAVALAGALEINQRLSTLCIEESWVGDEGCIAIGVALASNATLRSLKMTGNHISDEAGRAFATLVDRNKSISTINVRGNQVDHSTILRLKKTLKRNRELRENEEPNRLQKEVIRLHYQQCKLHEATQELQKNKKARERLQAEMDRHDEQLQMEQAECQKKMKELTDKIGREVAELKEIDARRHSREKDFEKFCVDSAEEIEQLSQRLREEEVKREEAEVELMQKRKELEDLKRDREQRNKDIRNEVVVRREKAAACRKEAAEYREKLVEKEEVLKLLKEKEEERRKDRERKAAEQKAAKQRRADAAEAKRKEVAAAEKLLMM